MIKRAAPVASIWRSRFPLMSNLMALNHQLSLLNQN